MSGILVNWNVLLQEEATRKERSAVLLLVGR